MILNRPQLLGRREREVTSQRRSDHVTPIRQFASVGREEATERGFTGTGAPLLAYVLAIAFLGSMVPLPTELRTEGTGGLLIGAGTLHTVAAGVLMIPLGFLWRLSGIDGETHFTNGATRVIALGAVTGLAIEIAQFLTPGADAALLDIPMAAAGAWIGARLFEISLPRLRAEGDTGESTEMVGLDLPLASLLYLLLPLMWLNALALAEAPFATLRLLLLGLFGSIIYASIQRRYLAQAGFPGRRGSALLAFFAYLIAAFPALVLRPLPVLIHAGLVAALCGTLASSTQVRRRTERRFERTTLLRAAPFLAFYLLLAPFVTPAQVDVSQIFSRVLLLELLQTAAVSVLIGYMVAEFRGRGITFYRDSVAWVVCAAAAAAGVSGWLAGSVGTGSYGTLRLVLAVVAGVLGGWLYHVQRDRVLIVVLDPPEVE